MAFATKLWNRHPVNRGGVVVLGFGGVCAVTIGTVGGIILFIVISLAMTAFKVQIENLGMTGRAVHRLIGGAWTFQVVGDCGMALSALDILVN